MDMELNNYNLIEAAYLTGFEPSSDDATEAHVLEEATVYLLTLNR